MKRTYGGKRSNSAAAPVDTPQTDASVSLPDIMMGLPDASPSRPRVNAAVQLALQKPAAPQPVVAAVAASTLRSSGARSVLHDEIAFQLDGLEAIPRTTSVCHASLRALARLFADPAAREIGRQRSVVGRLLRVVEAMSSEGLRVAATTASAAPGFRLHWQTGSSTTTTATTAATSFDFPAASGLLLLLVALDCDAQCVDIITPHVLALAVRTGVEALCTPEALDAAWDASAVSCNRDFAVETAAFRDAFAHTCASLLQRCGASQAGVDADADQHGVKAPRKRARVLLGMHAGVAASSSVSGDSVVRNPDEASGDRNAMFRDMLEACGAPAGVTSVLDVAIRLCHRVTHAFDDEHVVATGDDAAFIATCVKDVRDALLTCVNGVAPAWLTTCATLDYMALRDGVRGRGSVKQLHTVAARRLSHVLAIVEDVTCMSEAHTNTLLHACVDWRAPWLQTAAHALGAAHAADTPTMACNDSPSHCSGMLAVVAGLVVEHARADARATLHADLLASSLRVCVNLSNHQKEAAQTLAHTATRASSTGQRGSAPITCNVFESILEQGINPRILPRTYVAVLPHFDTLVHALSVCANVCEHSFAARRSLLRVAVGALTHTLCVYAHDDDVHADDVALCAYITLTLVCVCGSGDSVACDGVLRSMTASSGRCACASVDLMQRVLTAFALMQARAGVYTQEARAHVSAAVDTLTALRAHAAANMCKQACTRVSPAEGVGVSAAPKAFLSTSSSGDEG